MKKSFSILLLLILTIFSFVGCSYNVDITLQQIKVTTKPTAVQIQGEALDTTGMVVTGYYNNNFTSVVSEYTVVPSTLDTVGEEVPVTISYQEKTDTIKVKVVENSLQSICVKTEPKVLYSVGEKLDLTGLVLEGTYLNGKKIDITSNYTSSINTTKELATTDTKVTFTYQDLNVDMNIYVYKAGLDLLLDNIEVTKKPINSQYKGKTLDTTGMVVTATYSLGEKTIKAVVSDYTVTPSGAFTEAKEDVEVKVTFEGKEATFKVNVLENTLQSISVKKQPNKMMYKAGDPFDTTGLVLEAKYLDGSTEEVTTDFTSSITTALKLTDTQVSFTYQGKTTVMNLYVYESEAVLDSIAVTTPPGKQFVGENLDTTGMVVTATYKIGSKEIKTVVTGFTTNQTGAFTEASDSKQITVSYTEGEVTKTTNVNVEVVTDTIQSISVKTQPTKMIYKAGETLNLAGLYLEGTYESGKKEAITTYTANPANGTQLTTSNNTITFTSNEKQAVINLYVADGLYNILYKDQGNLPLSAESWVTTAPETYTFGTEATLTTPQKTGYKFGGWYLDSACTGNAVTSIAENSAGDKILYAKWIKLNVVTFEANKPKGVADDVTSIPSVQYCDNGVCVTNPSNTPVLEGFIFEGWYKEKECTTKWNFGTDTVSTDTSIYAKWIDTIHLEPIYVSATDVKKGISGMKSVRAEAPVTLVNSSSTSQVTWGTSGKDSWYYVSGDLSFTIIWCEGNVHIILSDGCSINASSGILVTESNSLTIYSQSTDSVMGKLTATGGNPDAGIGGSFPGGNCGCITINGGNITANGGDCGAGIGGGYYGSGSEITINGGIIEAKGGNQAAGIGGGSYGSGSEITINGGTVLATGGSSASGIGRPYSGNPSNNIFISTNLIVQASSSTITESTEPIANTGADLSSNTSRYWKLTPKTTDKIKVTYNYNFGANPTKVVKYFVKGTSPESIVPVREGYEFGGWFTTATNQTTEVDMSTPIEFDIIIYAKWTAKTYSITYKDKGGTSFSGTHGSGKPTTHIYDSQTNLVNPTKDGFLFAGWYTESDCSGSSVSSLGATAYTANITLYAKWIDTLHLVPVYKTADTPVSGLKSMKEERLDLSSVSFSPVTNSSDFNNVYNAGWYYVDGKVNCKRIICNGNVNIILMDGCELNLQFLTVEGENTVSIYTGQEGTGILNVDATSASSAAIGSYSSNTSGKITINGGHITAKGGQRGAGIGSRYSDGKNIIINGGEITATGNQGGAGIGGGDNGSGENIIINGGEITATGGQGGAGIGGGSLSENYGSVNATKIYINGGYVKATGGQYGAGIGGGAWASASEITITGGTVEATGGENAAGIGAGKSGSTKTSAQTIYFQGGNISATGGASASGVGKGNGSNASSNIVVSSPLVGKAGTTSDLSSVSPLTTGSDISSSLDGKQYCVIGPQTSPI